MASGQDITGRLIFIYVARNTASLKKHHVVVNQK